MSTISGGVCITPSRNTNLEKYNNICIDWLNITWQFNDRGIYAKTDILGDLVRILHVNKDEVIKSNKHGFYGYHTMYELGTEIIFQQDLKTDPELHVFSKMLQLSGSACRDLERRGVNLIELYDYVQKTRGKITRFDLAYDDFFAQYCDVKKIYDHMFNGWFVSTFKTWDYRLSFADEKYSGHAITCGTKSSSVQLQIYDKLLERLVNYNIDVDFIDTWIRYEIRFMQGLANTQFENYINIIKGEKALINPFKGESYLINNGSLEENLIKFYFMSLYSILDLKQPNSDDSNKSRWETVDWWKAFLGEEKRIKISNQYKIESDIATKKSWVKRSVLKPMAKLKKAIGDGFDERLKELVDEKMEELTPEDFMEINAYKEQIKKTGELEDWFDY